MQASNTGGAESTPTNQENLDFFEGAVEIMEVALVEAAAAAVGAGSPMAYAVDGSATVASWRRSGGVAEATHGIFTAILWLPAVEVYNHGGYLGERLWRMMTRGMEHIDSVSAVVV